MVRSAFSITALIALAAYGCSAQSVVANSAATNGGDSPRVIQTGKPPANWTQFSPATAPGDQYWGITVGPDHSMWIAELNDGKLIRVSMTGGIKLFSLGSVFAPKYLAVGSDKNLWVTSVTSPAKIGRVTTSGVLTTFAVPSGETPLGGIAGGPDGNVWFTTLDNIARITPSGHVTEIPFPTKAAGSGGVTRGPDGDVWFTEPNKNKIGHINTATLAIKEIDLGTSGLTCSSRAIAAGSDGNLWIDCGTSIARVTVSGAATAFPYSLGFSSAAQELAPGPDGQIWISTGAANGLIAAINPSTHVVTSFTSPFAGDFSNAIVAGPDKNIWVTTQAQGHVDTFILQVMTVTPKGITFTATGQNRTLTVSEPHTNAWKASSKNPLVASVAPGRSANRFVVTAIGAGSTTVTIADSIDNSFAIRVTVR
jgi:virginiamycin B lyase